MLIEFSRDDQDVIISYKEARFGWRRLIPDFIDMKVKCRKCKSILYESEIKGIIIENGIHLPSCQKCVQEFKDEDATKI